MVTSDEPRRRSDSAETTRRLLEAAAAEFVERGYDMAVVTNIARRAGVTTGAVYARWANKNDLMVAALDHMLEEILPERRIAHFSLTDQSAFEILAALGTSLLTPDEAQDVLTQIFGSARNNAAVQASLQRFLTGQAVQLGSLVEQGKDEGLLDPELSTVAMALFVQAIGIGTHLLLGAGREERHVPSDNEWTELLIRIIASVNPPAS